MAGLFGFFNYTKPGPGVSKDGPPTPRIKLFFEILIRKIWELIKVNLLFLLTNLPAVIIGFLSVFMIVSLFASDIFAVLLAGDGNSSLVNLFLIILTAPLVVFPVITVGPAQAGMTYILRNYSREEHAFLFSDFKEHAIKNFKQSSIVSIINTVLYLLLIVDLIFFYKSFAGTILGNLLIGFTIFVLMILFMMCMYIYPMMVTFDYDTKQLYKNALLFSLAKFLPNILILAVCLILIVVPFLYIPTIAIILSIFITFSLISFIINFYVYPKMKKYIIDKLS